MDELSALIKELEHQPPQSLARQQLRLLEAATPRRPRRTLPLLIRGAGQGPARTPGRLALNRRWLVLGGAAAGAAVAASVVVPALIGSAVPAYALTKNPDGSINLRINEFRDPEQVEKDLADLGVTADITYLPLGKRCGNARAPFVKGDDVSTPTKEELSSRDPAVRARLREQVQRSISYKAIRPKNGITIYPRYIKPGETVMIEAMENQVQPTVDHPGVSWQFSGRLTDGPIAPCEIVDDPSAFEIGDATPPPGS